MIKELLYKWFRLEPPSCGSCEILREQLASSERERRELLMRLLAPAESTPSPVSTEDMVPIKPQFTPWRVKQQMLEQEDRRVASLLRDKQKEMASATKPSAKSVDELEQELGVRTE